MDPKGDGLFQKVNDLNLPGGEYALFGSTPLGVRGIRESRDAEVIDGLSFVLLEEVLKWKKLNGREKDLRDVELIMEYLKNNGN